MSRFTHTRGAVIVAVALAVLVVIARLLPHPWDVTPIGAVALLAGAMLPWRLGLPAAVGALVVSDLVIGLDQVFWATWGSIALAVLVGRLLLSRRRSWSRVAGASVCGSVLFFIITNFAVWLQSGMYEHTLAGLERCYILGIPFFRNALIGDLGWSALLFGAWAFVTAGQSARQARHEPLSPEPTVVRTN